MSDEEEGLFEAAPAPVSVGAAVIAQTIWGDEAGIVDEVRNGIVTVRTRAGLIELGVARIVRCCSEAEIRAGMTDDEFWTHVLNAGDPDPEPDIDLDFVPLEVEPCETCGALGACSYDEQGRALIHATEAGE